MNLVEEVTQPYYRMLPEQPRPKQRRSALCISEITVRLDACQEPKLRTRTTPYIRLTTFRYLLAPQILADATAAPLART